MRMEDMVEDFKYKTEIKRLRHALASINSVYQILVIALIISAMFLWFRQSRELAHIKEDQLEQTKEMIREHQERMRHIDRMEQRFIQQEQKGATK